MLVHSQLPERHDAVLSQWVPHVAQSTPERALEPRTGVRRFEGGRRVAVRVTKST